jgi:hypothetical protein
MNFTEYNPLLKTHWFNHSTNQWVLRDKNAYQKSLQNDKLLRIQVIRKHLKQKIAEQKLYDDIEENFLKYNSYIFN